MPNSRWRTSKGVRVSVNAATIYHLLMQIAHLLMQLMEKGRLLCAAFPRGFGSARNLAWRLLEALRNASLTREQYDDLSAQAIQRFAVRVAQGCDVPRNVYVQRRSLTFLHSYSRDDVLSLTAFSATRFL